MTDDVELPTDDELRERLTDLQYEVTQKGGTERAFTGAYWNTKEPGTYRCIVCDTELFRSDTKYDSGSGWPSFTEPMALDKVRLVTDSSHGMVRTEVRCATLRRPPRPRVPRRPRPHRRALLHELRVPAAGARRLTLARLLHHPARHRSRAPRK